MADITGKNLAEIIQQTPTFIASKQKIAETDAHQAAGWAGMNLSDALRKSEVTDPIAVFLQAEKHYLTRYETRELQKIAARKILDEARDILCEQGIDIPKRDETGWVISSPSRFKDRFKPGGQFYRGEED